LAYAWRPDKRMGGVMTIHAKLAEIQHKMRAPKDKTNAFGGYQYRNAEMILAAFKAMNIEGASLVCSDEMQEVAGQIFVTATATLTIDGAFVQAQGHAMHPLQKKGMDASQITGSASSYARKYALGGLFAIEDESQDPDGRDNRKETGQSDALHVAIEAISGVMDIEGLKKVWIANRQYQSNPEFEGAKDKRKAELTNANISGDEIPY